jgi:hypothetical protein
MDDDPHHRSFGNQSLRRVDLLWFVQKHLRSNLQETAIINKERCDKFPVRNCRVVYIFKNSKKEFHANLRGGVFGVLVEIFK